MGAIFNVSFIVWAKSEDSVHKPQFKKKKLRRERSADADRTEVLLLTSLAPFTAEPQRLTGGPD